MVDESIQLMHLDSHELTKIIRKFLSNHGVSRDTTESQDDNCINWKFSYEGIDINVAIYDLGKRDRPEIFIWIQTVVCRLDRNRSTIVMRWLLKQNYEFPHQMKFALADDLEAIFLTMRSYDRWITPEHLLFRLNNLGPFVVEMRDRLKRNFGLRHFKDGQNVMSK